MRVNLILLLDKYFSHDNCDRKKINIVCANPETTIEWLLIPLLLLILLLLLLLLLFYNFFSSYGFTLAQEQKSTMVYNLSLYKSSEGYIWQVTKLNSDSQFWLQDIQFWWLYHLKWSQVGGLLYSGAIPLVSPCSCLWLVCVIMENYFFMALLTVHKNFTSCEKCMVLHREVVGGAAEI